MIRILFLCFCINQLGYPGIHITLIPEIPYKNPPHTSRSGPFYEFVRAGVLTPHTALGRTSARLQLHAPRSQALIIRVFT